MENIHQSLEQLMERLRRLADQMYRTNLEKNVDCGTGVYPIKQGRLLQIAHSLVGIGVDPNHISVDLGCGWGNWALVAAALGIRSYGIDMNSRSIKAAKKQHREAVHHGIISPDISCVFAEGHIYAPDMVEEYKDYARRCQGSQLTFPMKAAKDPYRDMGITIKDATIIYAYLWKPQMPFLFEFLRRKANPSALLIFPAYAHYAMGNPIGEPLYVKNVQGDMTGNIFRRILEKPTLKPIST